MIPFLLPLLVSSMSPPEWVAQVLQDMPGAYREVAARSRQNGGRVVPAGTTLGSASSGEGGSGGSHETPEARAQARATALIERGEYEAAYREAVAGNVDHTIRFAEDPLVTAALFAGRTAEAERLLVDYLRRDADSEEEVSGGLVAYFELAFATARRGALYTGQGAYVFDEYRTLVSGLPDGPRLMEGLRVPSRPEEVASICARALGAMSFHPCANAYLEYALDMDPTCEPLARLLVESYEAKHRDADVVRVASRMVKSLPAGEARRAFAQCLQEAKARMETKREGERSGSSGAPPHRVP